VDGVFQDPKTHNRRERPLPGSALDAVLQQVSKALYPALQALLPLPDLDNPPALVLVPTGDLHRLPLHALPWLSYDRRLLDGYAVSYASTIDILIQTTKRSAARDGLVALAPGLPGATEQQLLMYGHALATMLASLTGGKLLLGAQATVAALLRDRVAAGVRWVYIAAEGRPGGIDAMRAGLLLHDEQGEQAVWLSAAEIAHLLDLSGVEHLDVSADVGPDLDQGVGLVPALLQRVARSVQVTLWPVRVDAATLLSLWTWEHLLQGEMNKAAALRGAMQRLRRCTGREAAAELRRLATALPADEPAQYDMEAMAAALAQQMRPFLRAADWVPFVLHGAPLTTPRAATTPSDHHAHDVQHPARTEEGDDAHRTR
jgi:CHAT domain-containing protein